MTRSLLARARSLCTPPVAFFALVSLWFTYPLWTAPHRLLNDLGDTRLNAWIMAWDAHALITDIGHLFDANIFYPHGNALALSENLMGNALLVAPVNWLGQPVLAYNILLVGSFLLTGLFTYAWILHLTGDNVSAFVGATVWTFAPSRLDHLPQIQLLAAWWIPAALLAFERYLDTRRRRYALLAAAAIGWQYLSGIQITLLFAPLLLPWCLVRLLWRTDGPLSDRKRCGIDLAMATLVAAALIVPVSLPYLHLNASLGMERTIADIGPAPMRALLSPSWIHRASHMQALYRAFHAPEANHFPGVVAGLLIVLACGMAGHRYIALLVNRAAAWDLRRASMAVAGGTAVVSLALLLGGVFVTRMSGNAPGTRGLAHMVESLRPALVFPAAGLLALCVRPPRDHDDSVGVLLLALFLSVVAFLLSLGVTVTDWGQSYGRGPYYWLYELMTPYRSVRAIGRFGLPMAFFGALGAAVATGRVLRHLPRRQMLYSALALLLAGILWEYRVAPLPAFDAEPATWVDSRLASLPRGGAVLHLPSAPEGIIANATAYMLGSTRHWRPLANGYSGFFYPDSRRLFRTQPFAPGFLRMIRSDFPVQYVVLHRWRPLGGKAYGQLLERALAMGHALEPVDLREDAAIFRVRSDSDRGAYIYRRFSARQLQATASLEFEIRTSGNGTTLQLFWGDAVAAEVVIDGRWQKLEIRAPEQWHAALDSTATVVWRSVPPPESAVHSRRE